MWKKGKRTSPLVTWQLTRRAGGVIHQTDLLKTQTHVATLQGYPPPVAICQVDLANLLQIFDFFYIFGGVKAKNGIKVLRLAKNEVGNAKKLLEILQIPPMAVLLKADCADS